MKRPSDRDKFQYGDTVRVINTQDAAVCLMGAVGVIDGFDAGVFGDGGFSVEFTAEDFNKPGHGIPHNCNGDVPSGFGQYFRSWQLELVRAICDEEESFDVGGLL